VDTHINNMSANGDGYAQKGNPKTLDSSWQCA